MSTKGQTLLAHNIAKWGRGAILEILKKKKKKKETGKKEKRGNSSLSMLQFPSRKIDPGDIFINMVKKQIDRFKILKNQMYWRY